MGSLPRLEGEGGVYCSEGFSMCRGISTMSLNHQEQDLNNQLHCFLKQRFSLDYTESPIQWSRKQRETKRHKKYVSNPQIKVAHCITKKTVTAVNLKYNEFPLPISSKRSLLYAAFFNTKGQVVVIYLSKSKWAKGQVLKRSLKGSILGMMCNARDSSKSKSENLDNVKSELERKK